MIALSVERLLAKSEPGRAASRFAMSRSRTIPAEILGTIAYATVRER